MIAASLTGMNIQLDIQPVPGQFDFQVGIRGAPFAVVLPHSCNEWEIVPGGGTKVAAIERMEKFVSEAIQTLRVLRDTPSEPEE